MLRFPSRLLLLAVLFVTLCTLGCGGTRDREINKDKDRPRPTSR